MRTGRRFACLRLVRDLPYVGADLSANCREPTAKTSRLGAPDTTKVACFRTASQPIADKSARPAGRSALCVRTGRRFACLRLFRDLPYVGADLSANCREPTAKPAASVHQIQPRWPVFGPLRSPSRTSPLRLPGRSALCVRTGRRFACLRLVRDLPYVGADLSANCREPTAKSAASVHQIQPRWPVFGPLRSPSRTSPLRPAGRSALCVRTGRCFACLRLVRDLPYVGADLSANCREPTAKTSRLGAPDTTKAACFWAASQPFANKFAPTPCGQKRVMCADRATLRLFATCPRSPVCRSGLVRELSGTHSKTSRLGAPDTTKVACFWADSQPVADKPAPTASGQNQKQMISAHRVTLCIQINDKHSQ
ncbi:hypothetical protein ALQ36_00118 [Pseudomonas syringae pv. primulae]|uniref:Uncharacterized protein n=1 Tax=Pseudomonas syringae pv. primulae TaxID=251707 RepID=A0A3M3XW10_9PSED|nr:hypothetical protein ALQ36_00118 [Pseudomonas syringae pv. primulae]